MNLDVLHNSIVAMIMHNIANIAVQVTAKLITLPSRSLPSFMSNSQKLL